MACRTTPSSSPGTRTGAPARRFRRPDPGRRGGRRHRAGVPRRHREEAGGRHAGAGEAGSGHLESINEGFVVLGADWNFAYVNAAFERMNGVRREDILGRNRTEVYPATVGTPLEAAYRRVLCTGETAEFENYYEPWDRWFMVKAYPSWGRAVRPRPGSDRRQAWRGGSPEKDERLQLLVGHATDYALIMTDTGGAFSIGRSEAERITGGKDEVRGQPAAVHSRRPGAGPAGRRNARMTEAGRRGQAVAPARRLAVLRRRGDGGTAGAGGRTPRIRQGVPGRDRPQAGGRRPLARDALLLANVHDAVVVTDLEGVVTYWNDGATRLFGWTARKCSAAPTPTGSPSRCGPGSPGDPVAGRGLGSGVRGLPQGRLAGLDRLPRHPGQRRGGQGGRHPRPVPRHH